MSHFHGSLSSWIHRPPHKQSGGPHLPPASKPAVPCTCEIQNPTSSSALKKKKKKENILFYIYIGGFVVGLRERTTHAHLYAPRRHCQPIICLHVSVIIGLHCCHTRAAIDTVDDSQHLFVGWLSYKFILTINFSILPIIFFRGY